MDPYVFAYNKAIKFLSYRSRSEKEVRDNLKKKLRDGSYFEPEIIERVVEKLKQQRFINDDEFAKMWIESRNRSKPISLRLLSIELKRKGISQDIIDANIVERGDENETDLQLAKKIVEMKIERMKHLETGDIYRKLGSLLARRGFSWQIIRRAIDDGFK